MTIRFSGTAALVENAFHTEIHNLEVKGEVHIGNMSDPQIPAALAPAVVGVKALHNFFPKPMHKLGSLVKRDAETGKWLRPAASASDTGAATATTGTKKELARPQFGIPVPKSSSNAAYLVEDVVPYDFATIYNVLPLWNAGIDGTGQTIAIAGTSSINLSDITTFRSTFGLPTSGAANTPQLLSGNSSPVTVCTSTTGTVPFPTNPCTLGDLEENSLDVEWSGAVAKNAQIVLVSSYPTSASDDTLWDSESYILNNSIAKVMNVSYGECELGLGTTGNVLYNDLWQSAAAAGVAVFVSSGDSGSASCDDGNDSQYGTPWAAQNGLSVSGLASTPYNTAVGGTDFNWCNQSSTTECTASPYWNSTNNTTTGASAAGYIPEVPWNDTCSNPLFLGEIESLASELISDGLGATAPTSSETACNFIAKYALPVYEEFDYSGTTTPVDISYFVDTVGGSGGASNCTTSDSSTVASCAGGYGKPTWQANVTGIPADNKRDIPDVSFFAANGMLNSSYLICVSEMGACVTSNSITAEPTAQEVGGTSVASPTMAGVMALVNQKTGASQGNPNSQLYALAAKQTYSDCSAENGKTTNGCYFNDIDSGTNAMPCDYGAADGGILYNASGNSYLVPQLSGINSPNCTPATSGDTVAIQSGFSAGTGFDLATGLGSLNVANVVNAWVSTQGSTVATLTVVPSATAITTNQALTVNGAVTPPNGTTTIPTGTVTLTSGSYTPTAQALSSTGTYSFSVAAGSLAMGSDTLKVAYSGDATFASATNTTATVKVTGLAPTVNVTAPAATNSNVAITVSGTVTGSGPTPTGTVTLTGGGYTSTAQTLSSGAYSFTVPANSLAAGSDTLAVTYSGDSIYVSGILGTAPVVVTYVAVLTPTVTVSAPSSVDSNASFTVKATVTGASTAESSPSGTVTLSGGGLNPTLTGTLVAGVYSFTVPAGGLTTGSDTLTATYSGDADYYSGTGTAPVVVNQAAFTLAATTPTAISKAGGSSSSTVTVTASNGYAGTVTLTCALTSYTAGDLFVPTCSVPATAVAMGGTTTISISTTAATSELAYPKMGGKGRWAGAGGGAVLALLVFLGIPARRRSWRAMVGMVVLAVSLGSMSGCGGGSSGSSGSTGTSGTTADTYTFTVTGTGSPAVTPLPTTTFSVVVN
jgi:hypothetical protein